MVTSFESDVHHLEADMFKTLISSLLQMGLLLLGPFLLGAGGIVAGIAIYLLVMEPTRVAALRVPENKLMLMNPQPLQVSPGQTNVIVIHPPADFFLGGQASNAAIWANGKSFNSGLSALGEMLRNSWRLWLLCAATMACGVFLKRRFSRSLAP
jgi:hypothetical protein